MFNTFALFPPAAIIKKHAYSLSFIVYALSLCFIDRW